ncbi:SprT family protein [Bacillus fonticola]|uniref:SprT family protein n=1 Tax=Bacillus fonticola TaxID=2728853 RepID=UPI0014760494|nr:SprT family protein [Bacillus fonticola]
MNDISLQKLVQRISQDDFRKPFLHKALFNTRLQTTGGRYLLKSHDIEVNPKYVEKFGHDELVGIIKHELCHYHLHLEGRGYRHRDRDFRVLMQKVGAPRFCSRIPQSYLVYRCQQCDARYRRRKRMDVARYVCGACKGKLIFFEKIVD